MESSIFLLLIIVIFGDIIKHLEEYSIWFERIKDLPHLLRRIGSPESQDTSWFSSNQAKKGSGHGHGCIDSDRGAGGADLPASWIDWIQPGGMSLKEPQDMIIYNLFPLLAGPLPRWKEHFTRIRDMGFNWVFVNPVIGCCEEINT